MDVILDANAILEDAAFARAQFKELFAYLRRTNSRLVLPTVIRDEVEARFREKVIALVADANRCCRQIRTLSGESYPSFPTVDIEKAVTSIRARMEQPGPGIRPSLFPELQQIDFNDVIQRGIKRQKPASGEGEELRDVVVWLHVKRYAAEQGCEIAFVSRDLAFRASKDAEELHPDLATELVNAGLSISFHPDIGGFIRAHALTERPVTEAWMSQFLRIVDLRGVATSMLVVKGGAYGTVEHAEIDSLDLSSGTEYEVAQNFSYIEAVYKGTGSLRIIPSLFPVNFIGEPRETLIYNTFQVAPPPGEAEVPLFLYKPTNALGLNLQDSFVNILPPITVRPVVPETKTCSFTLDVSGRVENEKLVSAQIDDLQIRQVSSLAR